jgi:2'-5' RNA ligase
MNRVHHTALAIVPPNEDTACWIRLQEIRDRLHDKGYFRWPPHINLSYPFIDSSEFGTILPQIANELQNISPFQVHLDGFDTFGGKDRGVCYLAPQPIDQLTAIHSSITRILQETTTKPFRPHLTVKHCVSGYQARFTAAQESRSWESLSFLVDAVYVLQRDGFDGQFYIAAKIPLGDSMVEDGPRTFDHMPAEEPDWVKDERDAGRRQRK